MRDSIDELAAQWEAQRPGIDAETMAIVARLLRVAQLMGARIDAAAKEHGLTRAEGDILFTLRRAGGECRLAPSRLAESLLVASGTLTSRLDALEARGLIERLPNPGDRRGLDVRLTAQGRRLVDAAIGEHVAREQAMLAPLTARERDQLAALTRKVLAHLQTG